MKMNFQNIGTLLALVISIAALFVSIYEADLMQEQQKAMVWPYLTVGSSYNAEGYGIEVENDGTGPAIIQSIQIQLDNQSFSSWEAVQQYLRPTDPLGYDILRMQEFSNTVIIAGEEKELIGFPWTETTREVASRLADIQWKVCYCSVVGDCWEFDSSKKKRERKDVIYEQAFED